MRFYTNLDLGCVRILKYAYAYMKYAYAYAALNTDLKKKINIFRDLIKQTYNMWGQTSMIETLKN